MSILAITSWQLGEVERVSELINMANASRGGARPRPVEGPSALSGNQFSKSCVATPSLALITGEAWRDREITGR